MDQIAALRPGSGETARDCYDNDPVKNRACPEMVVVPAGRFTMGSPDGTDGLQGTRAEEGRQNNEGPVREVTIAQPFAVGKFEVTFDEWAACVTGGGCQSNKSSSDEGWGKGRRPVINVSWSDAQEYVAWLSRKAGCTYRLLSEAEWEYAARAGTTTPFSFGATISTDQANYDGNYTYGNGVRGPYLQTTVHVGSLKAPNAWGLHDMHGNVWEWVEDCWIDSYRAAPTDGSARTTACTDYRDRVVRGGSWYDYPQLLRAARRDGRTSGYWFNNLGFRVARSLPSPRTP